MYFLLFSIFDVLRIFAALQMFFYKFLLRWGKTKKILCPAYSLKLKNVILFVNQMVIFAMKIDVENDNVVSTLSNVVQFNVENHSVISTLFNVANFNADVQNVASTLI